MSVARRQRRCLAILCISIITAICKGPLGQIVNYKKKDSLHESNEREVCVAYMDLQL